MHSYKLDKIGDSNLIIHNGLTPMNIGKDPLSIKKFYQKYRDYILFNKNIIISGIFAFFGGALFTQFYSLVDNNSFSNSIVTLAIEYCIYLPIFGFLFYSDNKSRYFDPKTGKKDYDVIKSDIRKLFAAFAVSEIIFSISKVLIHYELLILEIVPPYQASMIASLSAWAIFLFVINLSVRAVHLFRSK